MDRFCLQCNTVLPIEKINNKFCNRSCSVSFNNKFKKGIKRVFSIEGLERIKKAGKEKKGISLEEKFGKEKADKIKSKISKTNKSKVYLNRKEYLEFKCKICNKVLKLRPSESKNRKFCSGTCRNKYNNQNIIGTRSKPEKYIEQELKKYFPSLQIIFNDRKLLSNNKELDFYFPELSLAIEWNGPWHYLDLRTKKFRENIQNKDKQKLLECAEKGIKLIVVKDMTSHKKFYEKKTKQIIKLINRKIQMHPLGEVSGLQNHVDFMSL